MSSKYLSAFYHYLVKPHNVPGRLILSLSYWWVYWGMWVNMTLPTIVKTDNRAGQCGFLPTIPPFLSMHQLLRRAEHMQHPMNSMQISHVQHLSRFSSIQIKGFLCIRVGVMGGSEFCLLFGLWLFVQQVMAFFAQKKLASGFYKSCQYVNH